MSQTWFPGNSLLREVFSEFQNDSIWESDGEDYPSSLREDSSGIGKVRVNYSALDAMEDLGSIDNDEVLPKSWHERGIHAIAWYLPYRVHGDKRWGIYIDSFSMVRLTVDLTAKARRLDGRLNHSDVGRAIEKIVLRHEFEHANQEIMLAQALKIGSIKPVEVSGREFSKHRSYRETIACHFEHFGKAQLRSVDPRALNIVRRVWQEIPSTGVYNDWRRSSISELDRRYEAELGLAPSEPSASDMSRDRLSLKGRKTYLRIPIRWWSGNVLNFNLTGADLRANSLDCKKVQRFLVKGGNKLIRSGLGLEPSSDHDLKLVPLQGGRPIKFSCHDWDLVPDRVLKQIADACEIPKAQLIDSLRQGI